MRYWCLQPGTSFSINFDPQHRYVLNPYHKHVYVHYGIKLIENEVPGCKHQYHMILKLFFNKIQKIMIKGIITNIIFIHALETIFIII